MNSNRHKETWMPIITMPKDFLDYCSVSFWGMDKRADTQGNNKSGFFVDIETFDETHTISLLCEEIYCIRWANESGRIKMGFDLRKNQPDIQSALVYVVQNSKFTQWLLHESDGMYNEVLINHYVLMTSEDIIDILSQYPPVCLSKSFETSRR